jgi:glycine amidinotransferase
MECPVNSHNEWDVLEEVIIGNGFPEKIPIDDISFRLFFHDNIYGKSTTYFSERWGMCSKIIDEHNEDLENFVILLQQNNVTVRRPKKPTSIKKIKTLGWNSINYPALNVRDLTMIVGNTIIETPVSARWRQFENDYMKHIFLEYFNNGARWLNAPRPIATDNSYDLNEVHKTEGAEAFYFDIKDKFNHELDCGYEIMFDAANCQRLGDKILFNAPTKNEMLGVKWLQDILGETHTIWPCNITDHHIDSVFLPLRPGLALITLDIVDKLPRELQKWDFIRIPAELDSDKNMNYTPLASEKIYCNVLSLNPNKIICLPEYYPLLSSKLKPYNIEVIPSQIRYSRLFGGGHHCLSLDIRRQSKLESYF